MSIFNNIKLFNILKIVLVFINLNFNFFGDCPCCKTLQKPPANTKPNSTTETNITYKANISIPDLSEKKRLSEVNQNDWDITEDCKNFILSLNQDGKEQFIGLHYNVAQDYYNLLKDRFGANPDIHSIDKTNSTNFCKKITLNDGSIVYCKHDNKVNKFYIELLKNIGLCKLEYSYNNNCLMTTHLDMEIINCNSDFNSFTELKNIVTNSNYILPFYIILAFLNLRDCSLDESKNIMYESSTGKFFAYDINPEYSNSDFNTYEDFFESLNHDIVHYFKHNVEAKIIKENDKNDNIKNFDRFFITLTQTVNEIKNCYKFMGLDTEPDKDLLEKLKNITTKYCSFIELYCEKYKNFKPGIIREEKIYNAYQHFKKIFIENFNCDLDEFLKDLCNYVWNNKYEDDEENFEKYKKDFGNSDNLCNFLKEIVNKKIYEAIESWVYIHNYFHNNGLILEKLENITDEEKKTTIDLFIKMLKFLTTEGKNYNTECYKLVKNKILAAQQKNLFPFIFNDKNVKSLVNKL